MIVQYRDLECSTDRYHGIQIANASEVLNLLQTVRYNRAPFMCEFVGANGYTLTIGISSECGCAQYAASNGLPPYLMAAPKGVIGSVDIHNDMEFSVGGTCTPIDGRFRLSTDMVDAIVVDFVETGSRSSQVEWQEV